MQVWAAGKPMEEHPAQSASHVCTSPSTGVLLTGRSGNCRSSGPLRGPLCSRVCLHWRMPMMEEGVGKEGGGGAPRVGGGVPRRLGKSAALPRKLLTTDGLGLVP